MAKELFKVLEGSSQGFDSLIDKDSRSLYFVKDRQEIWKGGVRYSSGKDWSLVDNVTLTDSVLAYQKSFSGMSLKEVWFEAVGSYENNSMGQDDPHVVLDEDRYEYRAVDESVLYLGIRDSGGILSNSHSVTYECDIKFNGPDVNSRVFLCHGTTDGWIAPTESVNSEHFNGFAAHGGWLPVPRAQTWGTITLVNDEFDPNSKSEGFNMRLGFWAINGSTISVRAMRMYDTNDPAKIVSITFKSVNEVGEDGLTYVLENASSSLGGVSGDAHLFVSQLRDNGYLPTLHDFTVYGVSSSTPLYLQGNVFLSPSKRPVFIGTTSISPEHSGQVYQNASYSDSAELDSLPGISISINPESGVLIAAGTRFRVWGK